MTTGPNPSPLFGSLSPWDDSHSPALSPLDGRYRKSVAPLSNWLSEDGLNRSRVYVEARWIDFLLASEILPGKQPLTDTQRTYLYSLADNYSAAKRQRLSVLEAETRHDVKAVEYLLREHLAASGDPELESVVELAHFLCTSEDINNLAYALCIKEALHQVWIPSAEEFTSQVRAMAQTYADSPMLARTHGQPATPTTMGKELAVFTERLAAQLDRIQHAEVLGKLNGATGTYSAHVAVLPEMDWESISEQFVTSLGLTWNPITTQIEPHDWQIRLYSDVAHFNRIAHNLATDCWQYISLGYFTQRMEGTTGSSTMPHKINPIRFENAEANMELSNAIFDVLCSSLATTRMQRDLSDSSLQRNIGVAFGYSLVAIDNLKAGLSRLGLNRELLLAELADHPEVLSEAIQQALRLGAVINPNDGNDKEPYALLKELTQGHSIQIEDIRRLVESSALPSDLKQRLLDLEPETYIGLAKELALGSHR